MPSYQEALSADATAFTDLAAEITEASIELTAYQIDYGSKVTEINTHWEDTANEAFNGEVGSVNDHLSQVIAELDAAAAGLKAAGDRMFIDCNMMTLVDASWKAAGFDVLPTPMVVLSAAQRAMIASAGPLAGLLEASLQMQAGEGTLRLETLLGLINSSDATGSTALDQSSALLRPLDDKTGGTPAPPAPEEEGGAPGQEEGSAEEEQPEEEPAEEESTEEEDSEEPPQEDGEDPAASDRQQPETPQAPQMPQSPQTPPGLEDLAQPDLPEVPERPWDAPADPDDLTGGLASGGGLGSGGGPGAGGLGGGLGSGVPGAGAGAVPTGGMGGAMTAPVAAANAAGAGARPGAPGMMGAGAGGRGAGAGDDEDGGRESNLTEDDEDVWGIVKAADDPYE
ncbi:hypothetical protein LO763_08040 [Glycomyces sp. A-F 0318]|uniref:hypothetical protein n=1 Tax=Glycomyces amatae TaxID=2881355 RepID=UPI001E470B0C|nr:hypothetical protein [Glycomyces amatae]MCD0443577.1 hypothetical protein [Glycomyces amatae]